MIKFNSLRVTNILLASAGLVLILIFILTGKGNLLYDEFNFVPNIFLLEKYGLSNQFLLNIKGSAGPAYGVYHHCFFYIQPFDIMTVRLANYSLLLVLLASIYFNARLLGYKDPLILTLNFIAIPFVWVFCGLGLTEVPTMACGSIGFFFFLKGILSDIKFRNRPGWVAAAGIFFSFSVMGRSFYLMAIIAMLCWFGINLLQKSKTGLSPNSISSFTTKQLLILFFVFVMTALPLPLYVFNLWGTLTPPLGTEAVGANKIAVNLWYGILACSYSGVIALILAPSWFLFKKNVLTSFAAISVVLVLINVYFGIFEFAPLHDTMAKLLPAGLFVHYGNIMPGLLASVALWFLVSTVYQLWLRKDDSVYVLIGMISLFIVFSTIKVTTQFSSRYVGQAIPFFILMFAPYEKTNLAKIIRILLGLAIGALSLYSYYNGKF